MKLNFKIFFSILVSCFLLLASAAHAGVVGNVNSPLPSAYSGSNGEGLFKFISNVFKLLGTIGGIYLIFQLITAGYAYLNSMGDPKAASAAWTQIWQSLLGMVIIASAFVIAAVVSRFTGIDILNPTIYGP